MEIKEIQNKCNEIVELIDKKVNMNHDANNTILHLVEELGELCRQVNNKNIRNITPNEENFKEELADVFILLGRLANLYNIDIEKEIIAKIEKLKIRHNLN